MSDAPRISVVIPAFDAQRTLPETLAALRAQAFRGAYELIVVDNGSSDATARVAREGGATVLHEARRGPAAARNCGLRAARAEIVAHLDADTLPSRSWLNEMAKAFDDPKVVLVAGNTLCYPPQTAAERYVHASKLYDTERAITRAEFPFAPSLNVAVRRAAALGIGGWDENLQTGEDVDFSHRILAAYPGPIAYAQRAVLYHHTRADARGLRKQAWTYGEGAAALYRRYPDELRWDAAKSLTLTLRMLDRCARPTLCGIGSAFGLCSREQAELSAYQSLWERNFWGGFFFTFLLRRRRYA